MEKLNKITKNYETKTITIEQDFETNKVFLDDREKEGVKEGATDIIYQLYYFIKSLGGKKDDFTHSNFRKYLTNKDHSLKGVWFSYLDDLRSELSKLLDTK